MPEIKETFKNDLSRPLINIIKKDILKSVSPNRSKRFPRYSASYGKAKKKAGHPRTVNLKLAGEMLKSLTATKRRGKPLDIEFEDEKAVYHNDTGPGGNKKKIRRVLPSNHGEEFNSKIIMLIGNILKRSVFRVIKINNR